MSLLLRVSAPWEGDSQSARLRVKEEFFRIEHASRSSKNAERLGEPERRVPATDAFTLKP